MKFLSIRKYQIFWIKFTIMIKKWKAFFQKMHRVIKLNCYILDKSQNIVYYSMDVSLVILIKKFNIKLILKIAQLILSLVKFNTYSHAESPNSVRSKNQYFSIPLVSETIKYLHINEAFFTTRFATYKMWNKIKFNECREIF